MGKVVFSLFNTIDKSSDIPHSTQAATVWLALIEANKKVPTIQCFLLAPSSQNVDLKKI